MPRGAIPEYPPILRGTVEEQMIQLREYIIRNIEAMQRDLTASGGTIYVDNGVAYVTINGSTMTLQEFIENYVNEDGNTINITVNANIETNPDLQEKTVTITVNGSQVITADNGKDGLSRVNISVNVPAGEPSGTIQITENGTIDVANFASAEVDVQPKMQDKTITINTNGTQTVTPDAGKDGMSSVEIITNVPQGSTPTGTINITTNGTHDVTNYASANVQVPSAAPNLQSKSVIPTASAQTVTPDTGYDGLSQVSVAAAPLETKTVTPSASQQIITPSSGQYGMSQVTVAGDADLIAGNIKKNVQIFGVTGSYEGASSNENGLHYAESDNASGGKTVDITTTQLGYGMTHTTTQDAGGGDIEAFNGYEIGEAAGSLIVCELSTAINRVVAKYGTESETALISNHVAYINIPYPFTSGTVDIIAYVDSQQVTSGQVTISGINKYSCPLTV